MCTIVGLAFVFCCSLHLSTAKVFATEGDALPFLIELTSSNFDASTTNIPLQR